MLWSVYLIYMGAVEFTKVSTGARVPSAKVRAKVTADGVKAVGHPGVLDIRAARNFSRFAPLPGAAHFSRFARNTDS